jgi:dextranase
VRNHDVFTDLRTAYLLGEEIRVSDVPAETAQIVAETARGSVLAATFVEGVHVLADLPLGTHAVQALADDGRVIGEEFVGVRRHRGEDPVMGFATLFDASSQARVLAWHRRLRCTVVQVYDWMDDYSIPLAATESYEDPLGRPIERTALKSLIRGIQGLGAVAQAYAPVPAAGAALASQHPQWRLYRTDGSPQSLGDLLQIMNPGNADWQRHWIDAYGAAADSLGFDGFHLDTYGYPRKALDDTGSLVSMEEGYAAFISAVRQARPEDALSFNQVNGVPRGLLSPEAPSFRYVEVWPPNDLWRHFEGLLERSSGGAQRHGDTLAVYPPVWQDASRDDALRTCVVTEAVATMIGANLLIWGDDWAVLRHPYYVDHEGLREEESEEVLKWRRFALRCRDLFRTDTDTTWYELADENASVVVSCGAVVSPEPIGGSLWARVIRGDETVVVGLLDLSGSPTGSWRAPTGPGTCTEADVNVLVDRPQDWRVDVAVLGHEGGRFQPLAAKQSPMREGIGLACRAPISGGWSILRFVRGQTS